MSELVLTSSQFRQIERHGERAYANECCGLIIGREAGGRRIVEELEELKNSFETTERYHRFSLDPLEFADAEKRAGQRGKLVLGLYHSHPDHPARPSEYDRQHAWPFYSYVIVAIAGGKAADLTSWQLNETTETFEEETITILQDERDTMSTSSNTGYAHPEALVSTGWVAEHLNDPSVKIVEVDVDTTSYAKGHVKNAIGWNWQTDLNDRVRRDIIDPRTFAELNRRAGIKNDDTVVLYGDNNNWFAAWALWQYKYHGHKDVRLMNGGRKKWELEKRELTTDTPHFPASNYQIPSANESIRAYRREIEELLGTPRFNLVDVRSPDEFTGKVIAPPGMSETAQRGGHIPGARNIPWAKTANEDGTFKTTEELRKLYTDAGVDFSKPTVAYCRIGERSSHTWFVLKYLLGVDNVKNYDGSWTEWGNLVGAPIEVGEGTNSPLPNVKCQ
ncbi:MAG TPA: rhodanese-like domain-containing protein [Tepidisphaeraceae bacterium]|nr:rhodanese-like domain-containing protein [Tepidisphaeraceae bacterium]